MAVTEANRLNWAALRSAGEANGVPEAIEKLRTARSPEEATRAYWQIDNTVVVQGALYEAAEPTIPCLLEALSTSTDLGRARILELLYQLGSGGVHREELIVGNHDLDERCRAAVKLGTSQYFYLLENGTPSESGFCADLIELCAKDDAPAQARARWWFERMLRTSIDENAKEVYRTCLKQIGRIEQSDTHPSVPI